MAKRQTQNTPKKARYFTDEENGTCHLPPNLGTGANIRLVTSDGQVIQSNPNAYAALSGSARFKLVGSICKRLGIPTKEQANG